MKIEIYIDLIEVDHGETEEKEENLSDDGEYVFLKKLSKWFNDNLIIPNVGDEISNHIPEDWDPEYDWFQNFYIVYKKVFFCEEEVIRCYIEDQSYVNKHNQIKKEFSWSRAKRPQDKAMKS